MNNVAVAFAQHPGKVIETGGRFKYCMAVTLDPRSNYRKGIVRCITSRDGDVAIEGFVDRSKLHYISGESLDHFSIGEEVVIKNQKEILEEIRHGDASWDFLGLEDPDIWIDEENNLTHLYFTIPFIHPEHGVAVSLGHAEGESLDSLMMTAPVLLARQFGGVGKGAKELSVAPENSNGVRLHLIESADEDFHGNSVSVAQIAVAKDMASAWEYGPIVFHPAKENLLWIGGHASPGPLLPRSFIDVGEGKLLGIMNGREANRHVGNEVFYGTFSIGLFIYDYEKGTIEWVSPTPFICDSEARTITFGSQFVETKPGEGILFAHVDDSFVRAYTLYAEGIRALLP